MNVIQLAGSSAPTLSIAIAEGLFRACVLPRKKQCVSLFDLARGETQCDHLTIFETRHGATPACLLGASALGAPAHEDVARAYCELHSHSDVVLRDALPAARPGHSLLVRFAAADAPNAQYRRDCYDEPRLSERLAVYVPTPEGWTWLNVYRRVGQGSFSEDQATQMLQMAPGFIAAARSVARAQPVPSRGAPLSAQEREVLRLSVRGSTAKEIARRLDLSPSTITTYRERAYRKLGVRNQRELVALMCLDDPNLRD